MSAKEMLAGRYEIVHAVGAGSSGEVYKAIQVSTGQAVAIKLLTLDALDAEQRVRRVERFRREIGFCSQLYHPDVVRLLDSGQLDGDVHFAVFEFIPGITLARLLADAGMFGVQRARNIMASLLPPLAYAHSQGIFHRDLKPSNIMVTTDGGRDRLKILDFGISIAAGQDQGELARLTLSHEWVGTPTYAAPEQLRGEPAGAKSDLYAWGLVFLECLTGTSVVRGRSLPEILEQHLRPDPHALPAALGQHRLGGLLLRVLEKNPARRSGSADAILATLETISTSDLEDAQGYLRDLPQGVLRLHSTPVHSDTLVTDDRPRQAERRDATVVAFQVTFEGAGALSSVELLDTLIEDTNVLAREILNQFGADTSHSFGGYSLAYFGLLRARETDARVALRAALEAIPHLERAPAWLSDQGLSLRVQVGIHNGPVTVQQRDGRREPVDGVTAGVATSLASLELSDEGNEASPRVVVSNKFRELVARHAKFAAVPTQSVRQRHWRDVSGGVYRLAAELAVPRDLVDRSIFVGRTKELAALHEAWVRSRSATGVAALVTGEAGIGKSRLARELRGRLQAEGVEWLEATCLPEWQNAFLRPLSTLVAQELRLAALDPAEASKTLERRIADLGLNAPVAVPLFCAWLALPIPSGHSELAWSPQKRRQVLLELLADMLIAWMERGAALLVEDLQWADPSTLEFLDILLRRARSRAAFVLMTSRPGALPPWTPPLDEITLSGLDDEAVEQLVSSLVPDLVPEQLRAARVAERSDGVPLYVEELAMSLGGPVGRLVDGAGEHGGAPAASRIPPSLRDLLASHLDDVGDAKRIAQVAGALGRDFSFELLAASAEAEEPALLGDLEQLVSAGLLVKHAGEHAGYMFRHVLIRDTAYESMPSHLRQQTHGQIAEALERRFRALTDTQPDIVAHHWEHAGHAGRAVSYWKIAARNSARVSAHLEALAQLDRAIALLPQLPGPEERSFNEAELMLARAATNVAKRGYTDPDAARCFERVTALVAPEARTLELAFAARWGLWYFHNTQANLRRSWSLAEELLSLSRGAGDSSLSVSAWEAVCETSFCIGRLEEAVQASRNCEAEYDFERHRHLCTVRGDDPHLASLSFEALAEVLRGRHHSAIGRLTQGLALAERLEYPSLLAGMHAQAAWVYLVWGASGATSPDLTRAREHAGSAMQIAGEYGFPFWEVYARMIDAAARIAAGEMDALPALREGSEIWRYAGARLGRCWHLTFIAEALRHTGDCPGALALLDEALAFCDECDSRYFEPEVRRLRAEVLLDRSNPSRNVEAAREECDKARASALKQGADWWLLAASMTAVRSFDGAGAPEHDDLQQALRRFPVAIDEPPLLREARALVRSVDYATAAVRP